jgi:hypothetical protein
MDRPKRDKIKLLEEAVALEKAGATWTQAHTAAICNYSESFIRRSDCPKHYEIGAGPRGKGILVYLPAEVREWKERRRIPIEQRHARAG